jgi:hypothetical protein
MKLLALLPHHKENGTNPKMFEHSEDPLNNIRNLWRTYQ